MILLSFCNKLFVFDIILSHKTIFDGFEGMFEALFGRLKQDVGIQVGSEQSQPLPRVRLFLDGALACLGSKWSERAAGVLLLLCPTPSCGRKQRQARQARWTY